MSWEDLLAKCRQIDVTGYAKIALASFDPAI